MTLLSRTDWPLDEAETLDPDAADIPLRLTRDELLASADAGWRRHGWRMDEMEDDQ
ncbi:hypothetical protein [Brevundimonas sp.]|uniref:hypothetical protein n=1 Tax=Brevundimonas sp. TaxID=1871086 RepID=UPI003F6E736A